MERSKQARVWGSLLVCAGLGSARAAARDEPPLAPPELTAPTIEPQPAAPARESTAPAAPSADALHSPPSLLIIPGVTAPRSPRRPAAIGAAPTASALDRSAPPLLESPAGAATAPRPRGAAAATPDRGIGGGGATGPGLGGRPARYSVPLSLEPIPEGPENLDPIADPAPAVRGFGPSSPSRTPLTPMTEPSESSRAPERSSAATPRRAPAFSGMIGRFFESTRPEPPAAHAHADVKVERKSDPAADNALRRRIERQIHEQLGDRVNSVEVRVVGRNVLIRAHAGRFWQKRSVRRTLESLPALANHQARVELD